MSPDTQAGNTVDKHEEEPPYALFCPFLVPFSHRLYATAVYKRMKQGDRGEERRKLLGGGCRGGDRQDLIKDCLCYVISSKRRRPRCCRDGEQLAWGSLIACSDSFQASSSGAHTRNGTDVYCWVRRRRLHGNRCLFLLLWSSDTSLSLLGLPYIRDVWMGSAATARESAYL